MKALALATAQPWAILPDMLTTILQIAAREIDPEAVAAKLGRPLENSCQTELRDGVAILPVTGALMRYANLLSKVSGATSIDMLATDFNQAFDNPDVKAIVLNIDSPGGTVAGVNEFAEMIYSARGKKPIVAYVSGMGASAAYWIASAADEIVLDATASVGSIGVVSVQMDDTERKAKAGLKEIQIVSSLSPRKRPDMTTDAGRADIQVMVDSIAHVFFNAVARNRRVTAENLLSDFGQGGLLVGVDAVRVGAADRMGSLEQVITQLSQRRIFMTEKNNLTLDTVVQQFPAIADSLRLQGAACERERIKAVEDQLIPGHEALIAALKFDGKSSSAEAALKILAAEKEQRAILLQNIRSDSPSPLPPLAELKEKEEEQLPLEEKCQNQWQRSAALRAEFGSLEAYLAYSKACSNGQVKILRHTGEMK